jgi:hypothetical protein
MPSMGDVLGASRWGSAMVTPQHSVPVTDASPQIDGGVTVSGGASTTSNVNASAGSKQLLYIEAGIVLAALALLWLMGAVVFKGARQ